MEFAPTIWIETDEVPLREVISVPDAIEFLEAWPLDKRGPFFYLAESGLQGALAGSIPIEEAKDSFGKFCEEAGILAEAPIER